MLFFSTFFFSSRRRHTRLQGDWSSDVCSSDLDSERWLAACSVPVSACAPTDGGAVATHADLAIRLKAPKSMENGFRLGASVAMPHPADHASVSVVQPHGSPPDDQLGVQSPVLPTAPKTSAWIP